ncbi:uncharacterized protein LOC133173302 [Saccostrea echinata]|uniref:uncharacterized protein LOC133173302 n=1 Tax=Saccostrea echinata TaxID=191078 RepID=UPI002A7EA99C|nr:uncharacterized protein LOC133173302 [Saccostrea echinata]
MRVFITVVLVYITTSITESAIFGVYPTRGNSRACPKRKDTMPYYFGETDLACMNFGVRRINRDRRTPPSRFTFKFSHRWIYIDGMYLEFGNRVGRDAALVKYDYPNLGNVCTMTKEKRPAGYTRLSRGCIKSCIKHYVDKFGNYGFYTNNCHHFVNKISILLCLGKKCPKWCQYSPEDSGEYDQENEDEMEEAMKEIDERKVPNPH